MSKLALAYSDSVQILAPRCDIDGIIRCILLGQTTYDVTEGLGV